MAGSADAGENPDFRTCSGSARLYLVLTPDFTIVAASDASSARHPDDTGRHPGRGLFRRIPDNTDDPSADGKMNLRASLKRVISQLVPMHCWYRSDIRRPESQGGFEERYWSPVNSPAFGKDGKLRLHHFTASRTSPSSFVSRSRAARKPGSPEALRSRVEKMEAEILSQASELAEANQNLRKTHEELKSALREPEGFSYSVSMICARRCAQSKVLAGYSRKNTSPPFDEEGRRLLRIIRDGGAKMGRLIDGLLGFRAWESKTVGTGCVDMNLLVSEVGRVGSEQPTAANPRKSAPSALRIRRSRAVASGLDPSAVECRQAHWHAKTAPDRSCRNTQRHRDHLFGCRQRCRIRHAVRGKLFGVFQRLLPKRNFRVPGVASFVQRIVNRHGGPGPKAPSTRARHSFALPIGNSPQS
jgi:hypothetical protein